MNQIPKHFAGKEILEKTEITKILKRAVLIALAFVLSQNIVSPPNSESAKMERSFVQMLLKAREKKKNIEKYTQYFAQTKINKTSP